MDSESLNSDEIKIFVTLHNSYQESFLIVNGVLLTKNLFSSDIGSPLFSHEDDHLLRVVLNILVLGINVFLSLYVEVGWETTRWRWISYGIKIVFSGHPGT